MIDPKAIADIIETYKKYGWVLRRIIVTPGLKAAIAGQAETLFGGVPIITADVDAAWFSRPAQAGSNAWEIRHLSTNPYALVEHVDENSPDLEQHLAEVEGRLRAATRRSS